MKAPRFWSFINTSDRLDQAQIFVIMELTNFFPSRAHLKLVTTMDPFDSYSHFHDFCVLPQHVRWNGHIHMH
jgi:hypothetical protein